MERGKTESIASLSPELAWRLLTQAERQLILDYLATVLEKEVKQDKKNIS